MGLPRRKEVFDDIFSRMDTTHERVKPTDGQTPATTKTALAVKTNFFSEESLISI